MSLWRINIHLVWATKDRQPLFDEERAILFERIARGTCGELGVPVHAIGRMPDHVHLAISHPPRLALAETVKLIKGRTSHSITLGNEGKLDRFSWQPEYGAISFGDRSMPRILDYIAKQREHHRSSSLIPLFESWSSLDFQPSPEGTSQP